MSSGQLRIKFFVVSRASNILYRSSRPPVRRRFIAGGATLCALVRTATPPEFVDTVLRRWAKAAAMVDDIGVDAEEVEGFSRRVRAYNSGIR